MKLARRLGRDVRASAAAEMALILPAVAFVFLNVADLGIYLYSKMQVDLAAQAAVGAARVLCDTDAELPATASGKCPTHTAVMAAAAQSATSLAITGNPTITEAYYCATSSGTLTQVAAVGATVPANCSATVSGSTAKPGDYISASVSYAYSPIFPGASVASVLTTPITRTAWIRLK